jgi:oligopeptide/dipeptide ABC transporter ATP-binding protein
MNPPVLEVRDLSVEYRFFGEKVRAVDGVSFRVESGDTVGLLGESGCGKSTVAKAIMKILPSTAMISGGRILFEGRDLVPMSEGEIRDIRWKEISMIFQSSMNALDPVYRIEDQIVEAIELHSKAKKTEALDQARSILGLVGIDASRGRDFPHQLSGGMRQRVCVAMAVALTPKLVIADEATTALDVIVKDHILQQMEELQRRLQNAFLYISHDISLIAETCNRVMVMYAGKIVEEGSSEDVFLNPCHPYTMGLLNAFPELESERELISIPGFLPDGVAYPVGCRFADRCPFAFQVCAEGEPGMVEVRPGHFAACHRTASASQIRDLATSPETWEKGKA